MSDTPPGEPPLPPASDDPFLSPRSEFGGLSLVKALQSLAQGQQEIAAAMKVQPLPGKASWLDAVTKIADVVASAFSKIQPGGNELEKRAVDMLFSMGQETMN